MRKAQPAVGCGIRSVALNKRLTQGLRDRRKRARAYPLHNKASYKWARSVFLTGCNKHSPQTNAPLLQPASSNRFSGVPPAHLTAASEPLQKPFALNWGHQELFIQKHVAHWDFNLHYNQYPHGVPTGTGLTRSLMTNGTIIAKL